jgi:DNA (cytosine-5)-methyltransferase 1
MQPIRVLDLFCGGGGSSYGARSAGAQIVAGVDACTIAAETYGANFPDALALNATLAGDEVSAEIRAVGPVDLLLASPECTNHTCARGSRPVCEESRMTAWQVLHHAREFKPRWMVVENVVQMRSWDRFRQFEREILGLGYQIWPRVIDASDYGVPQARRRLFLICSRDDKAFDIHPPEGVQKRVARDVLDPVGRWPVTLLYRPGRAQATLERAERGFEALGKREPFLMVYYGSDAAGGWQPLDRPLRTLTTLDRFALVEPSRNGPTMRMLQVPELKRAMGFGDGYKLDLGTRRERVKMLGNGVCPPVMEHIVNALTGRAQARSRTPRQLTLVSPVAASAK